MQISDTEYQALADRLAPKSKPLQNCLRAFLCGGAICVLGQGLLTAWQAAGLPADRAATLTSVSLIFLSALLTGLSVFDDVAKFAGAGTLVPITGFANSITAPAIEFKTDESDIIGLSQKAFKHLDASMMI